jgi:hypothetical protein
MTLTHLSEQATDEAARTPASCMPVMENLFTQRDPNCVVVSGCVHQRSESEGEVPIVHGRLLRTELESEG